MSKQFGVQPRSFQGKLKLKPRSYLQLFHLGKRVTTKMTGNANFPSPNPTIASVNTALGDLQTSLNNNGGLSRHTRGGKTNDLTLIANAETVYNLLNELLGYVLQTVGYPILLNTSLLTYLSSGFVIADIRSVTKAPVQKGTFVKVANNNLFNPSVKRLSWRRPAGLVRGRKLAGYNLYNATDPAVAPIFIGFTTKTNFLVPIPAGIAKWVVKVVPVNQLGEGNPFYATVFGNVA